MMKVLLAVVGTIIGVIFVQDKYDINVMEEARKYVDSDKIEEFLNTTKEKVKDYFCDK